MFKFLHAPFAACLLAIFFASTLSGCDKLSAEKKFHSADISEADFGTDFSLIDHSGKARTLADFRGKAVVMFFGYTHCPDVCPTTLSDVAQAFNLLGKDANRVQVLFVTVDPERDTQALLADYVPAFNPAFLGLYGDAAATLKVARDFRIFYQKNQGKNSQHYNIDHTAGSFVFDPTGKLRLFMSYGVKAESIAHDLQSLLAEPQR